MDVRELEERKEVRERERKVKGECWREEVWRERGRREGREERGD